MAENVTAFTKEQIKGAIGSFGEAILEQQEALDLSRQLLGDSAANVLQGSIKELMNMASSVQMGLYIAAGGMTVEEGIARLKLPEAHFDEDKSGEAGKRWNELQALGRARERIAAQKRRERGRMKDV